MARLKGIGEIEGKIKGIVQGRIKGIIQDSD